MSLTSNQNFTKQTPIRVLCSFDNPSLNRPKLLSKAVKVLDYTFDHFIQNYCSNRSSHSLKEAQVEEYNYILMQLCLNDVISLSDITYENGVKTITDIHDDYLELCEPSTLSIFERKGINLDYELDLRNTNDVFGQLCVDTNKVPFDTFVSVKLLHKQIQCARRGIEFALTFTDMKRLMSRKRCYYSGVELTVEGVHSLSLDRIDSTKGYSKDNTVACSAYINSLKNDVLESKVVTRDISPKELKRVLLKFADML